MGKTYPRRKEPVGDRFRWTRNCNENKRKVGICGCAGLMAEYADDDPNKKVSEKAYAMYLTRNTDKSAYCALWNLFN